MLDNYSGATRIYPLVGDPIAQTMSPRNMTRAFEAAGRDAIVVPWQVAVADIENVLAALGRTRNIDGILATVPHKFAAFGFASTATERARFLQSANVLRRNADGGWHADMTDGVGLVRGLQSLGCTFSGRRALLVGAGGAGSAVGYELADGGIEHLAVHDIDSGRRDALLAKLNRSFPGRASVGSDDPTGFDIVVNATMAGMRETDPAPVRLAALTRNMTVADLITAPEITPLIAAARQLGCLTQTGVGMHTFIVPLMLEFFAPAVR